MDNDLCTTKPYTPFVYSREAFAEYDMLNVRGRTINLKLSGTTPAVASDVIRQERVCQPKGISLGICPHGSSVRHKNRCLSL
jgi:hypothetical protein